MNNLNKQEQMENHDDQNSDLNDTGCQLANNFWDEVAREDNKTYLEMVMEDLKAEEVTFLEKNYGSLQQFLNDRLPALTEMDGLDNDVAKAKILDITREVLDWGELFDHPIYQHCDIAIDPDRVYMDLYDQVLKRVATLQETYAKGTPNVINTVAFLHYMDGLLADFDLQDSILAFAIDTLIYEELN